MNTLTLPAVLAEEERIARKADEDFRALTPLFQSHTLTSINNLARTLQAQRELKGGKAS